MSAVATGLRMALLAGGQALEVATAALDVAKVTAAHQDVGRQYPPAPPHGGGEGPLFCRGVGAELPGLRWPELCSEGGGGGVAHPLTQGPPFPSNLHGC